MHPGHNALSDGAYEKVTTIETTVHGFLKTDIWPINVNILNSVHALPTLLLILTHYRQGSLYLAKEKSVHENVRVVLC